MSTWVLEYNYFIFLSETIYLDIIRTKVTFALNVPRNASTVSVQKNVYPVTMAIPSIAINAFSNVLKGNIILFIINRLKSILFILSSTYFSRHLRNIFILI
jgi:hypothetical protein